MSAPKSNLIDDSLDDNPVVTIIDPPPSEHDQEQVEPVQLTELNENAGDRDFNELADVPHTTDKNLVYKRLKSNELCIATRQMATLLRAGMPLVPTLNALVEQMQPQAIAQVIQRIADRVTGGWALADALQEYPNVFSPLYINMVKAGQAGGTLDDVLKKLADMLEKRARLKARIRAAMAYPALMAVASVAVVIFLLAFVIPDIANIFLDMDRQLPLPTRFLIAVSNFIREFLLFISLGFCAFVFMICMYIKSDTGKIKWDRLKLKLPVLGPILLKIETIRLTRTLGIMLNSGISILEAIKIAQGVIQNSVIFDALDSIRNDITDGHSVAQAIKHTGLFPPIIYHTIAIGEMSGNMEQQLIDIAGVYDDEIEVMVRSFISLLEPAILLIMGLVVGFIVLAILLPIFEINQMI